MINWFLVAGVIWMVLVAATISLALSRISTATYYQKLAHAGLGVTSPLRVHLRHVIRSQDRIGIALTISALIYSVILVFILADQILRDTVHKLVQIL